MVPRVACRVADGSSPWATRPKGVTGSLAGFVGSQHHEDVGDQQQDDGRNGRGQPGHLEVYSALIPSFLIMGTTSLSSLSSMPASSCGVLGLASAVRSAKRFSVAGSVRTLTIASCSLASTSGGSLA